MTARLITSIVGGSGMTLAAIAAYLSLRMGLKWSRQLLLALVVVVLIVNGAYFAGELSLHGLVNTLDQSFSASLLLATLVALVALVIHFSPKLSGLDGFLLLLGAAVQFSSLTALREAGAGSGRAWFVSHPVAFALSALCFTASGAAAVAYLLISRLLRRKRASTLVGSVAPLESLERFGKGMLAVGFPLFSYGILTGLCGVAHREDLGEGTLFSDPTAILSFTAWVIYAYLMFASLFRSGLRGRKAATLATWGLALVLMAFFLREIFSPLHGR